MLGLLYPFELSNIHKFCLFLIFFIENFITYINQCDILNIFLLALTFAHFYEFHHFLMAYLGIMTSARTI